ncbi:hypothetical protein PHJA_002844500 [Phtheirospermum japonicum]|uniref:Uncharacterized protein n=1 Tax=Phtheirospermum japonicum TaxID=374723 RepID=A0A830DGM7_9LAMI|nr:hypothetical protein PHJA_002844500 [Phtheirospermum japonicum]
MPPKPAHMLTCLPNQPTYAGMNPEKGFKTLLVERSGLSQVGLFGERPSVKIIRRKAMGGF